MLEFVEKYKARPVDMQLQVFIGSIDPRRRSDLLAVDRKIHGRRPPPLPPAHRPAVEEAT